MKIAISVPDPIFDAAEALALYLRKSRSQLYAEAVQAFVRANNAAVTTERLNAVYPLRPEPVDPALARAQSKTLSHEAW